jgi:hypothetical protein
VTGGGEGAEDAEDAEDAGPGVGLAAPTPVHSLNWRRCGAVLYSKALLTRVAVVSGHIAFELSDVCDSFDVS